MPPCERRVPSSRQLSDLHQVMLQVRWGWDGHATALSNPLPWRGTLWSRWDGLRTPCSTPGPWPWCRASWCPSSGRSRRSHAGVVGGASYLRVSARTSAPEINMQYDENIVGPKSACLSVLGEGMLSYCSVTNPPPARPPARPARPEPRAQLDMSSEPPPSYAMLLIRKAVVIGRC